jgi:hypothetical protein
LQLLLQAVLARFNSVQFILHISSIASVHHIQEQRLRSWTAETDPSSTSLQQPYDRFKRGCEELIAHVATEHNLRYTSLRLGAIFSDAATCIQCSALALQCYTGPYLPVRIDCNSSRNASHMIHLLLYQERPEQLKNGSSSSTGDQNAVPEPMPALRPVYYYTRCVSQYPDPVPYGEFLLAYFQANHDNNDGTLLSSALARWCRRFVWLPHWLVLYGFVLPFRWCTMVLTTLVSSKLPYVESIDYLLQVTVNEHSFDLTDTVRDFPDIVKLEETMQECFARRRRKASCWPIRNYGTCAT